MNTELDDVKKLAKLIKGIEIAMMTTRDEDGTLHARPMQTQNEAFDGTLWFFTPASSHKVHEVDREHQVNLSYARPKENRYVSVSGTATLVRDRAMVEKLWTPALKAWFPKGKDDPDVALLKVDVTKAEYWDAPSSTIVKLAGFAKAALTGHRYRPGENEKLNDLQAHA